ncbi:MAG: hypothetical protein ACRYFR_19745 [Janthinobacterium lividum]
MPVPAIDWNSLASPEDWGGALAALQAAATAAKASTTADRQAVENELANFWTVPCPFTKKIEQARKLYNELVLIDLGQIIERAAVAGPPRPATAPARALAPPEEKLGREVLQALTALHEQHRQHLATHLAMAQQINELRTMCQQLLPKRRAPARTKRKPPPAE